jgi:hypothetical protein
VRKIALVLILAIATVGCTSNAPTPAAIPARTSPPSSSSAPAQAPTPSDVSPTSSMPALTAPPSTGWPVSLQTTGEPPTHAFGADGGLFVEGNGAITAYDPMGHVRSGWPVADPVPPFIRAMTQASDGSLLVADDHAVSDVTIAGHVPAGWPIALGEQFAGLSVGPRSIVAGELIAGDSSASKLIGLTLGGPNHLAWTLAVPQGIDYASALAPDGTMYQTIGRSASASILAVAPTGTIAPGYPIPWYGEGSAGNGPGFALAPDGGLVAWAQDTTGYGGTIQVRRTRFARLSADGSPAPGWPVVVDAPASAPAFGPDGTMYLVTGLPYGPSTGSITAIEPSGRVRPGWPVRLPAGCSGATQGAPNGVPPVPTAPTIDPLGHIYVAAECAQGGIVAALEPSGREIAGAPWTVPQRGSAGILGVGATGLVFLGVRNPDLSFTLDALIGGRTAKGWPIARAGLDGVYGSALTDDGGLAVVYLNPATQVMATRFLADGTTP